jgi:uncharacterized phage infection (PIP) family protein YhgE
MFCLRPGIRSASMPSGPACSSMPPVLRAVAFLLPLTYTVDGLRGAFSPIPHTAMLMDTTALGAFFLLFILPATKLLGTRFA